MGDCPSLYGSSQRSLELITAMCVTKRDIFIGRSSGRGESSGLGALRRHWTSSGHNTALSHSEPSFLRNINSGYTCSHLENWVPLLFMERGCRSRSRFPVSASSFFPQLRLLPRSQDSLEVHHHCFTSENTSSSCSSNQRPAPLPFPPLLTLYTKLRPLSEHLCVRKPNILLSLTFKAGMI